MSEFRGLSRRKLAIVALLLVLLLPLSMLSQPAPSDRHSGQGGQLAQLRAHHRLGAADIGQIDPRSETVRLVSLGLGGFANVILWNQADKLKDRQDWTGYRLSLDQLSHLQPYYPKVWEFQAWNLAYNVASEFDDRRQKYEQVIEGIRYLQRGSTYLEDNPQLLYYTGWIIGHKIGKGDDRILFRRLFMKDDAFHRDQFVQQRDNWLFARDYYRLVLDAADNKNMPINFGNPVIICSEPIRAQMFGAVALENDHLQSIEQELSQPKEKQDRRAERLQELDQTFLARIRGHWHESAEQWQQLDSREFALGNGEVMRFQDADSVVQRLSAIEQELLAIAPGLREKLTDERQAKLTPEQREAVTTPEEQRTKKQQGLVEQVKLLMNVSFQEVASHVPSEHRAVAEKLAAEGRLFSDKNDAIQQSRKLLNREYWVERCQIEQLDDAREARRLLNRAIALFKIDADLVESRKRFEEAFVRWRRVIDGHAVLLDDQTSESLREPITLYQQVLQQLDEPFPEKFILQEMLDAIDQR